MFYETQDIIVQKAFEANTKPKQVLETMYEIQISEGNKVAVFKAVKKDNNFYIIESFKPSYNNSEN